MRKELTRLVLPRPMLRRLEAAGVYCQTLVTAERQARSGRWVLRAVESGGSTSEIGRYISFFSPDGSRLARLQRLDRIGSNGVHAVVIAPELISVEMARIDQTYQLLIARHRIGASAEWKKPPVDSIVLLRGIDGQLSPHLLKQGLTPEFFTRAGEVKPIPEKYVAAVTAITEAVSCVNCRHCHGLIEQSTGDKASDVAVLIAS